MQIDIQEMWERYKSFNHKDDYNTIITHYYPIVIKISRKMSKSISNLTAEELQSYGALGLMDAVKKFDPDRGIKFETYANVRISGSIYDEMRDMDWVPRSIRSKAKAVEKATRKLEEELSRTPTASEVADDLDWDTSDVDNVATNLHRSNFASLEEQTGVDEDSPTLGSTLSIEDAGFENLELKDLTEELSFHMSNLPEKEKIVCTLFYWEQMSQHDIGHYMGVTESRVCQIHGNAVDRIKKEMLFNGTPETYQ